MSLDPSRYALAALASAASPAATAAAKAAGVAHLETAVVYGAVGAALLGISFSPLPASFRKTLGDRLPVAVTGGLGAVLLVATALVCRLVVLFALRALDPGAELSKRLAAAADAFWFDLALFSLVLFGVASTLKAAPRRGWIALSAVLAALAASVFLVAPLTVQPAIRGDVPAPAGAGERLLELVRRDGVNAPELYVFKSDDPTAVDVERAGPFARLAVSRAALERPTPETYAALGHLLGHAAHHDLWGFVVLTTALGALLFLGLSLIQRRSSRPGAAGDGRRRLMFLPASAAAIWAFIPISAASFNLFDRMINLRADAHAVAVTGDPEALCRWLVKDSPGADPDPNVLDRVFFYDHPPLRPRLLRVFAPRISSGLNATFASAR